MNGNTETRRRGAELAAEGILISLTKNDMSEIYFLKQV
jgi:hypothetical protein